MHKINYKQGIVTNRFHGEHVRGIEGLWDGTKTHYVLDSDGDVRAFDVIANYYTHSTGLTARQVASLKRALQAA